MMKEYLHEIGELIIRIETNWRKPLLDYLIEGIVPADEMEAALLKNRATKFALLDGSEIQDWCVEQGIQQRFTSVAYPQANRQIKEENSRWETLVLRRAGALRLIGKLAPNWEGPYKITRIVKFGEYELEDIEGRKLSRLWNAYNLRKFYS
ncbi:UNVERIFIED_CONTAM: hypothetical protein Sradi_6938100 [Sesamum radiatum]|uniref:Uncharacterized protein n=1 Tax=Sesamum radiatum TaxID=300843 RepID=A0AAW2JI57_SESRA